MKKLCVGSNIGLPRSSWRSLESLKPSQRTILGAVGVEISEQQLQGETEAFHKDQLKSWAVAKKLNPSQIQRLLCLLDPIYLHSIPIRKKSRSWPKFPDPNTCRHHFYRQSAHILGWIDQKDFGDEFTSIVRSFWPDKKDTSSEAHVTQEGKKSR